MDTARILAVANELNNDLIEQGVTEVWLVQRKILGVMIKAAQLQLNYEGMNQRGNKVHVAFFEGGTPMTPEDRKILKEAAAINRQIGKQLRELRLAKK